MLGSVFRQVVISVDSLPTIGWSNGLTVRLVPGVPSDCLPKSSVFLDYYKLSIVRLCANSTPHRGQIRILCMDELCVHKRPGSISYGHHCILYGVIRVVVFDVEFSGIFVRKNHLI